MTGRMLIAGVGNIFLGDDGFGVEVANRLAAADLPDWVQVTDYGIRGMHLAYDLSSGYQTTILIDAVARGAAPGTVCVIEPELPSGPPDPAAAVELNPLFNAHGMQPDVIFGMLSMLGGSPGKVLIVGCEPASLEHGIGLSEPVAAAVDEAVRVLLGIIEQAGRHGPTPTGRRQEAAAPDLAPAVTTGKGVEHVPWHSR